MLRWIFFGLNRWQFFRSFASILGNIKNSNKLLVSVGDKNSKFFRLGWKTLDLIDADYVCDIRRDNLPFADEEIDLINCSHIVEHLPFSDASMHFYREVWRVLKPGGLVRIVTPDSELLVERYLAGDWRFFLECDGPEILRRIINGKIPPESLLIHNRLVSWFASYSGRLDTAGGPIVVKEEVDRMLSNLDIRQFSDWCVSLLDPGRIYSHVNLYTYGRLAEEMREAGFRSVFRKEFGDSCHRLISNQSIDQPRRKTYSMYLEAVK